MTFFPGNFDPRDDRIGLLDLMAIDTPDGTVRLIIGTDAVFRDTQGRTWYGSQLFSVESMESAINGVAPAGTATLAYFQDPAAGNLITMLKDKGAEYIDGENVDFFVQPMQHMGEFYRPSIAPLQWCRRTARTLTFSLSGAVERRISMGFEAWTEGRRTARRIAYNTEGHAALLGGVANPSLQYKPNTDFQRNPMFR
ncbi:hypothetical protein AL035_17745 [Salipiger aestuarii]|uniref:Uncharacterized protein n=1 Tax=Salipiger aestuarii TaxID=568098 RepID=A0A327YT61_9RHOB|nr:hypothetical protein [Salipiger aestuarii]KAB2539654.1 hypothetical protein AL035_17745 [Salipiger aestuarii]RAK24113.1 hypothetical protein ATI53_1001220 [Salipiger aestuarii]